MARQRRRIERAAQIALPVHQPSERAQTTGLRCETADSPGPTGRVSGQCSWALVGPLDHILTQSAVIHQPPPRPQHAKGVQ